MKKKNFLFCKSQNWTWYKQNNEKWKIIFLEFGGSRKSQVKIDFSSIKDPICSAHY